MADRFDLDEELGVGRSESQSGHGDGHGGHSDSPSHDGSSGVDESQSESAKHNSALFASTERKEQQRESPTHTHGDILAPTKVVEQHKDPYRVSGDGGEKNHDDHVHDVEVDHSGSDGDLSLSLSARERENTESEDFESVQAHAAAQHSVATQDLLLTFEDDPSEAQQHTKNADIDGNSGKEEFESGVEDVIITPTAPEASFMNQLEDQDDHNEATPPRSPSPPQPVYKSGPEEIPDVMPQQSPAIATSEHQPVVDITPPVAIQAEPYKSLLGSVADSTTPSSDDRPVKMPKATTISAPSKSALARSSNSCSSSSGCLSGCLKQLDPRVWDVLLWRDPRVTGAILGGLMFVLLSLASCSIISVVSYTLLLALTTAVLIRLAKAVIAKVHTGDGVHPFRMILDADVSLSEETVVDCTSAVVPRLNAVIAQLRDLVLCKDFIPSLKLALVLYAMTYIGGCFNGLTLLILVIAATFTLPKVYEVNKAQIDMYVEAAQSKYDELYKQMEEKIPYLKKQKTQ